MKKLIALLLAVLMALTGALACAEIAPMPSMSIVNAVTFDRDACRKLMADIGLDGEHIEFIESAMTMIEASGQNLILDENGFEYNLIIDGNTVATLAGDFSPEGVAIGSNLFPNYIVTASNETIANLLGEYAAEAVAEETIEAAVEASVEAEAENAGLLGPILSLARQNSAELAALLKATIIVGEPETGAYTVDGYSYNTMLPVSVDMRAIADGVVAILDQFIHSEPVTQLQEVLRSVDINIPLEVPTIDEVPVVSATFYKNQDQAGNSTGSEYVKVEITGADGTSLLDATFRRDGENIQAKLSIPAIGIDVSYEQRFSDDGGFKRLDVNVGEAYYGCALEEELGEESHLSFKVFYLDPSIPLMVDDIAVTKGGQRLFAVEGKKKKVLSLEELMSGEEGNRVWVSLLTDVALYSAVEILSNTYQGQFELINLIGMLLGA